MPQLGQVFHELVHEFKVLGIPRDDHVAEQDEVGGEGVVKNDAGPCEHLIGVIIAGVS
jgi:hypothetical protein